MRKSTAGTPDLRSAAHGRSGRPASLCPAGASGAGFRSRPPGPRLTYLPRFMSHFSKPPWVSRGHRPVGIGRGRRLEGWRRPVLRGHQLGPRGSWDRGRGPGGGDVAAPRTSPTRRGKDVCGFRGILSLLEDRMQWGKNRALELFVNKCHFFSSFVCCQSEAFGSWAAVIFNLCSRF